MSANLRKIICLCVLVCMALSLTGCGSSPSAANDAASENTASTSSSEVNYVTILGENDPMLSWDPGESWAAEIRVLCNIYETLIHMEKDGSFTPVLAEEWSVSDDNLTWTFKIRQGVKFHSGADLTAYTCADSLNRTIEMGKSATYMWDGVTKIYATDDTTLVFECERPIALLYLVSATYAALIYNPEYDTDWYNQCQCDGTGPYMLESYTQNSEVILKKNENYWKGWEGDHFDYCIFKTVYEAATARQMMITGEADLWNSGCPYEYVSELEKNENILVSDIPSYQTLYAYLNCQKEPLNDVRVRKALSYLTPYDDIVDQVVYGYGTRIAGLLPPTIWAYDEDAYQYEYDYDKAVELLNEAGYADGFTISYTYNTGDAVLQKVGELLKDSFAKANITLELQAMTSDAKYAKARAEDPNERQDIVVIYWWPDYVDPSSYYYSCFYSETAEDIGFNLSYYYNSEVDELIDKAFYATGESLDEAKEYYLEATNQILDDAAILSLFAENYTKPYVKSLGGYEDNAAYPTCVYCYDLYRIS